MWRNKNPCTLLGGLQNDAAIVGNHLEVPQKVQHKIITWSSKSTPRYIPKNNENICPHKNLYTMFIAALFIIVKRLKQPKCLSKDEWLNKLWYIQTMQYYSAMIKWSIYICYNLYESGKHAKWKRLDTNGHMSYVPGTLLAGEHIRMWLLQEPKVKRKGQQWEPLFQTDFQELRLQHPQNLELSTLSASGSRQEKKDHVGDCPPSAHIALWSHLTTQAPGR